MSEPIAAKPLYHFYHSAILAAPLATAWAELRDFARTLAICFGDGVSNVKWLDHGSEKQVPARISFRLQPGDLPIEEEVVARSETAHSLTYRTVGQALSFASYLATFTMNTVTTEPGLTFVEWRRELGLTPETNPAEFVPFYAQLVDKELANLKAYFASTPERPASPLPAVGDTGGRAPGTAA